MALYRAFGLTLRSELDLPGLRHLSEGRADLVVEDAPESVIRASWSGPARAPVWETCFPDGHDVRVELGVAGDQLIVYGALANFHLSADLGTVACYIRDPGDPHAVRFLLDTVLWWVCLSRGLQVVHAGAVESEHGVMAFASGTGGGKTSLAAEFLRRGCSLFADDVLVLEHRDDGVVAHPGPPLMNVPCIVGYPEELGRPLARFATQGENWVAVTHASSRPSPVAALFLLRRAEGLPRACELRDATVLDVLPHLWGLPHVPEGAEKRFRVAADLVASTPVYDLTADLDTPAATLADLVERTVAAAVPEPVLEGSAVR